MWTNPTHFTLLLLLPYIHTLHTLSFQPQTTYEYAGVLNGVLQPGCTATSGFYSPQGYYYIATVGEFLEWTLPVTFTGDFIIQSEALFETIDATAAAFMFVNTNSGVERFGFDGGGKRYFIEGSSFPLRFGAPSPPPNVYLNVEIVRFSNIMEFRVNGDLIFSEYYDKDITLIGYRPHRSSMRIRSLYTQSTTTDSPTHFPTTSPTRSPTSLPTKSPTSSPTPLPTSLPTKFPTSSPTVHPTSTPTKSPTSSPTPLPTSSPTESEPTIGPTSSCQYESYALVNSTSGESIFVHYSFDDIGRVRYYTLPVATWKLAIANIDRSSNDSVLLYQQEPSRNDCYGWQHSWTQVVELDGAKLGNFKFWSINSEIDAIDGVAFQDEVSKAILYYSLDSKTMNSPDILVAYPYRNRWLPAISKNVALVMF